MIGRRDGIRSSKYSYVATLLICGSELYPTLEPLQLLLYVSLERLANKLFKHPTPPALPGEAILSVIMRSVHASHYSS